jgi:hypothetical protein
MEVPTRYTLKHSAAGGSGPSFLRKALKKHEKIVASAKTQTPVTGPLVNVTKT